MKPDTFAEWYKHEIQRILHYIKFAHNARIEKKHNTQKMNN